jgi:hypothetical protein
MITNAVNKSFLKSGLVVFGLWVLFELIWLLIFGVHFNLEATKYINEAKHILYNGKFSQSRYVFYSSTIAIIAFSLLINIGLYGALCLTALINFCAYLYFFRALQKLFTNRILPYVIIVGLLSFWPYQSWTLYLYSESIFYSAVLFLFSHLILFKRLNVKFLINTFFFLGLLIFSRPLGVLFVLPALLFILFQMTPKQRMYFSATSLLLLILLNYIVQVVFTTTPDWNMDRAISEGDIICDIPGSASNQTLILTDHPNQLYKLFFYIFHNPKHFSILAVTRLKFFFLLVRDYYSTIHNLYLITHLIVIYGSILFGLKRIVKTLPVPLNTFIFSTIISFSATIALQCDDYHNRFFLTLTPFFITWTAIVFVKLLREPSFFSKSHKD